MSNSDQPMSLDDGKRNLYAMIKRFADMAGDPNVEPTALSEARVNIDSLGWRLICMIAHQSLGDKTSKQIQFNDADKWAVNYGLFGFNIFEWEHELTSIVMQESVTDGKTKVAFLTDWMQQIHETALKLDVCYKLKEQIATATAERDKLRRSFKKMTELAHVWTHWYLSNRSQARYDYLIDRQDVVLPRYLMLDYVNRHGGLRDRKQRIDYVDLKQEANNIRAECQRLVINQPFMKHFENLYRRREEAARVWAEKDIQLLEWEREAEELDSAAESIDLLEAQVAQKEELKKLRTFMEVAARRGRGRPSCVPLSRVDLATPRSICDALALIEEYDPKLFHNNLVYRNGHPTVIIVPGFGEGRYDWSNNTFVIPSIPNVSVVHSVSVAVMMYREDLDHHMQERRLSRAYAEEINENKQIRSGIELRDKLRRDYVLWVTKETHGTRKLSKETRKWFEYYIAPSKREVKNGLGLKPEYADDRLSVLQDMADPDENILYQMAVSNFQLERYDKAGEYFQKVYEMNPKNLDALYNLGLSRKMASRSDARECFIEYMQKARGSWWANVALDYSR